MANPAPTTIWLTDRSRIETGLDRCQRARFLNYHWGPSGYGVMRKAESIPLAAGIHYHGALAHLLEYVHHYDALPPDTVVRDGIRLAHQAYDQVITARGLAGLDQGQRLEDVVREQKTLIEGFVWAYRLSLLPWIHEQARVISVEHEDAKVIGCTCGLGDFVGTIAEHEARGCEGIGFQYRLDLLTEYRQRPGVVSYWEFKGTGQTGERWDTQWETMPQFPLGALMEQDRIGHPIHEAWVVGLIKGRREGDTYNPETKRREGELRQQSVLCYGYKKPANPPLEEEDWQAEYEYRDEFGKGHRLGKAYQKTGIWELAPLMAASPLVGLQNFGDVSPSEFWCKWMPQEVLAKQIALVGPLQVSQVLLHDIVEEVVAEEQRWKGILWELYQALEAGGFDWTGPTYQAALRRLVPRNFTACRRYGKRHQCQFVPECFYHEGWQDPLGSGQFIVRRPHHAAELNQLISRGLAPAEGWAEDDDDGDFS